MYVVYLVSVIYFVDYNFVDIVFFIKVEFLDILFVILYFIRIFCFVVIVKEVFFYVIDGYFGIIVRFF